MDENRKRFGFVTTEKEEGRAQSEGQLHFPIRNILYIHKYMHNICVGFWLAYVYNVNNTAFNGSIDAVLWTNHYQTLPPTLAKN